MDERDRFLADVDAGLPFGALERQEIRQELAAHLDDAIERLRAEGLTADAAARAALDSLGPPRPLADALTRARRSPHRLLAAAGAGTWAAVTGLVAGYLWGLIAVILFSLGGFLAVQVVLERLGTTWGGFDAAANAALTLAALAVAAFVTGLRITATVAARAGYPAEQARLVIIPIGFVPWTILALWVRSGPLDWAGVAVLLSLPAWFAVGGLRAGRHPARPSTGRAALALTVLLAGGVAVATVPSIGAGGSTHSTAVSDADWWASYAVIGSPPPDTVSQAVIGGGDSGYGTLADGASAGGTPAFAWVVLDDADVLAGWHDLRAEAWAGTGPDRLDPSATTPFAVAPATLGPVVAEPDGVNDWPAGTAPTVTAVQLTGSVVVGRTPSLSWAFVTLTGIAPDGRRYILSAPQPQEVTFQGTVWDWFAALLAAR